MELERLSTQQFGRFRDFIYEKSGIRIDDKKVLLLSNRVRRRLKAGKFEDFDVYFRFLTSPNGSGELSGFLDAVTTNETFFFRTQKHFEWLRNDFVTEVAANHRAGKRSASLRIWSAGCANGAEPYSIAICLAENRLHLNDWSLTVLGSDISEEILRAAREGAFNSRAVKSVTKSQRKRFFEYHPDDDSWQVRQEIKQFVEFKRHNLMEPLPEHGFDCVFIRNVLIYFDQDSKRVAIEHLLRALAPGGYLVVGPSEGIYDMLSGVRKISTFLYQKDDRS